MQQAFVRQMLFEFVVPLVIVSAVFAMAAFWPFDDKATWSTPEATIGAPPAATPKILEKSLVLPQGEHATGGAPVAPSNPAEDHG